MTLTRLSEERGWALVTSLVLMAVMLSVGLAALRLVDSGSERTREQRERESALNLDEGVLYAQSLVLAARWPSGRPAVDGCSSAVATTQDCPNAATLAGTGTGANFTNVDQAAATSWRTRVRDDDGPLRDAYDPAQANVAQTGSAGTCPSPCNYDFNGDKELWVQAQSIVRGHPRNIVAKLKLEELRENMPQAGVTTGALSVTNRGGHGGTPIIDATGSDVFVRCPNVSGAGCVEADPGQVLPAPKSAPAAPSLLTPEQLARFKQRAITDRRYYPGCPTRDPVSGRYNLTGKVVWIEGCANPPNLANQVSYITCTPPDGMSPRCTNPTDEPGLLIWHCGRADFQGSFTHRGVLYVANNSDGTCPPGLPQRGDFTCSSNNSVGPNDVMVTNGGFGVWGVLTIDGPGCLKVGSNGLQIKFDPNAFDAGQSYGTVGLVQNTWRELAPQAF